MLGKTIFVMLAIISGSLALNFTQKKQTATNLRLIGGTSTTTAANSWLALLYDSSTSRGLGIAAILSKEWLICFSTILKGIAKKDLKIYIGVDDSTNLTPGISYSVSKIVLHNNIDDITNAVALIKVCPKMSVGTAVTLPTAPVIYNPDSDIGTLFSYATDLQYVTKKIGEGCECDDDLKFDANLMFCLAEDATKTVNYQGDIPGPVIINNQLAGLLVRALNTHAEIIINISKYRSWIQTTTGL